MAFCSRPEGAGDAISDRRVGLIVLDKHVQFHDPSLNRSREIPHPPKPSKAVFSTVFPYNFWLEADNNVMSGTAVEYVGMDVNIKFCDSR